ncbi:MAG TPA: nucleotidyltransferase domain-containing protein [Drouetiella sp.]
MTQNPKASLILPAGTQVVTLVPLAANTGFPERPIGLVGKIINSPTDNNNSYLIQFPDGQETNLKRHEIAIRKEVQTVKFSIPEEAVNERELFQYIIYRCVVGSRAYGLSNDSSDVDVRGIYLPSADLQWSLFGVPDQIQKSDLDECFWELEKFMSLALKANPNILECLYTPLVQKATPLAQMLLNERQRFLSKLVYQTFNGYVLSQFRKLEQDLRTHGELKNKHVMHLLRLLLTGTIILREHRVPVVVGEHRDALLAVRNGDMPWEDANKWRLELHKIFDQAYETTTLPDRPDYTWANSFLINARRQMI